MSKEDVASGRTKEAIKGVLVDAVFCTMGQGAPSKASPEDLEFVDGRSASNGTCNRPAQKQCPPPSISVF